MYGTQRYIRSEERQPSSSYFVLVFMSIVIKILRRPPALTGASRGEGMPSEGAGPDSSGGQ